MRLNASYQANGLGGTEVLRAGGFPGTIVGPGTVTGFGSVLDQLFRHDYPTWAVGVSVSYPIGQSAERGELRAQRSWKRRQAEQRVKSAEARVIQQVRDAAWKVEMNAKRIETARAARELAEQRLDAEQQRFEVGMSTSFLVIQAQRDLAQATTERARRGARLRPVARRLRGAAAGGSARAVDGRDAGGIGLDAGDPGAGGRTDGNRERGGSGGSRNLLSECGVRSENRTLQS